MVGRSFNRPQDFSNAHVCSDNHLRVRQIDKRRYSQGIVIHVKEEFCYNKNNVPAFITSNDISLSRSLYTLL